MDPYASPIDSPRISRKAAAIMAAAVAGAVVLVAAAALFARSRNGAAIDARNVARVGAQLDQSLTACAEEPDPEACRSRRVRLAAEATGAASVCDKLAGADRDQCVWAVASDRSDPDSCAEVEDDSRAALCADTIYARLAVDRSDPELCAKVADEAARADCVRTLGGPPTSAACVSLGYGAAYCEVLAAIERAAGARDPSLCASLSDDAFRAECEDAVGIPDADRDGLDAEEESALGTSDDSADTDADGLPDGEEVSKYRSNPAKPDTDGDGFPDGEEVKNGYDPAGEGTI